MHSIYQELHHLSTPEYRAAASWLTATLTVARMLRNVPLPDPTSAYDVSVSDHARQINFQQVFVLSIVSQFVA